LFLNWYQNASFCQPSNESGAEKHGRLSAFSKSPNDGVVHSSVSYCFTWFYCEYNQGRSKLTCD
jgi:hypothetical protein